MDFNKPVDVLAFDWDDSELIEAYDKAMEESEKAAKAKKGKNKKANKENVKEEIAGKKWRIGNYCRAIFPEDGSYYEAIILDVQDKLCAVEFLGYGDYHEVPLDGLLESLGKKARQKQRKSVKKSGVSTCTSDTDYSCMIESKDVSKVVKSGHLPNGNTTAEHCDRYAAAGYAQHHPQTHMQPHSAPPQLGCNHAVHTPMVSVPNQNMGGAAHCLPPPPPPPMPPCASASNDPSLSAMLVSWYMAGYYTGLHQNQKTSHCLAASKPHCCGNHVPNHCGHFC